MSRARLPGWCLLAALAVATARPAEAQPAGADAIDYSQDTPPPGAGRGHRHDLSTLAEEEDEPAVAAPPAAAGSTWSTMALVRAVASTALVLLLIVVLGRLARRLGGRLPGLLGRATGGEAPGAPPARITQRLVLGPRHALAWVQGADGATFVVGYGDGGVSLLAMPSRPSFQDTMARTTPAARPPSPPPLSSEPADASPPR